MRTIAHISDLHFNRVGVEVAEALVEDLHAQAPSLTVISGDLTQRAREKQYQAAAEYLTRLPRPQLVVPGNHDIPLYDVVRRFLWPLDRYRRYITRDLRPVYQDQELLVVGINTARSLTWKEGRISAEQLLDVRRRACDAPGSIFKIVVTHHPFLPVPGEPRTVLVGRGEQALAAFEECGIDMLLAGHLHLGYHGDVRSHYGAARRSVLAVQASTAISTRKRDEPNAYNWITVQDPRRLSVAVRAWTGQRFEQTAVAHYARVDHAWRPAETSARQQGGD